MLRTRPVTTVAEYRLIFDENTSSYSAEQLLVSRRETEEGSFERWAPMDLTFKNCYNDDEAITRLQRYVSGGKRQVATFSAGGDIMSRRDEPGRE